MNKARGCFVTVVVIIVIAVLTFLLISFFNSGSGGRDILLLGMDEREQTDDFQSLTDTIIIYHVGSWGKEDYLVSIPRDVRVELDGYGWNKINAAYKYGGQEMIKEEVFNLTGIEIDRLMLVNFTGFKEIIDILGKVEIMIEEPLHDPLSGANFDPGTHMMDGEQALSFVRCRSTAGADLDRVDRQKYLLNEVIRQKLNFSIVPRAPRIIKVLNEYTRTDMAIWDFGSIGFVLLFSSKDINWLTIPVEPATIDGISYLISDEEEVRNFLNDYLK
jgi:polyisoprenyl-teichoic acid--peptidoglycan teichoic acid transferase